MTWRVTYLPRVTEEDIPALPKKVKEQIKKAIEERIACEPFLYGKPLRFSLSGLRRIRVGDYRVIYKIINDEKEVIVTAIGHRKDIYNA